MNYNYEDDDYMSLRKTIVKMDRKRRREKKKMTGSTKLAILTTLMVVMLPFILQAVYIIHKPEVKEFNESAKVEYTGTVVNVKFNPESKMLDIEPEKLVIRLNKNTYIEADKEQLDSWLNTELNLEIDNYSSKGEVVQIDKDLELCSVDCYDEFLLATYYNKQGNGLRNIVLASALPTGLESETMENKFEPGYFENITGTRVTAYKYSFEKMFMFCEDAIYAGKLGTETLYERLGNIENLIKYSKVPDDFHEEVTINLENIGEIKFSKIEDLKEAPGIYYSVEDGVIRMYNYLDDKAVAFITYVNNSMFMCEAGELVETNYDNLLVHRGFDNTESVGYRTFALINDSCYVFRVAAEASEQTLSDIMSQFGIDRNNLEVKLEQTRSEIGEQ